MTQKTTGIYKLLSNVHVYSFVQKIFSATQFRKKIIKKIVIKKKTKILDIGCGPAEILNYLPKVDYYGYDINPIYINYAKRRYKNRGVFFCKKFNYVDVKKLPKFDYILLFGILHHLKNNKAIKLLKILKKALKDKGKIISVDNIYLKKQNSIAKFFIKMDRGQNVRTKKGYINLLKIHFKKINSKIYHQTFLPYTWFVAKSQN